jgi:hypothetical protein
VTARQRNSPPTALIINGRHQFGTYDGPIVNLNPLDASTRLPAPLRGAELALRNAGLKEWEAFQLGNEEWFLCGAVYDVKSIGLLQLIATHIPSGRIIRWLRRVPTWNLHVARGLHHTVTEGSARGFTVRFDNDIPGGSIFVSATHPGRDGSDPLPAMTFTATGECGPDQTAHLVICHPFTDSTALYSHKSMMPASARLQIGGEVVTFEPENSFLLLDDHKGQYPRPMRYDWVTGASRQAGGDLIGFNLTANQIRNPEQFNENAVFINNEAHLLGAVRFERPNGVRGLWKVRDNDGRVNVTFEPRVSSDIHVGPRHVLAEYYGPYGIFAGSIELADGRSISVDGFHGMGEQKLIRA